MREGVEYMLVNAALLSKFMNLRTTDNETVHILPVCAIPCLRNVALENNCKAITISKWSALFSIVPAPILYMVPFDYLPKLKAAVTLNATHSTHYCIAY